MKICFVTGSVFSLGGIQRVLTVRANELSKNYEIDILCTNKNIKINRELYNLDKNINININLYENLEKYNFIYKLINKIIKTINKYTNIFNNKFFEIILLNSIYPKYVRKKFINYFNTNNYDLVIGVADYYSLLVASIADELDCKTIGWQHNSYEAYFNNKYRYLWNLDKIFEKYIKKLDKYIVLTEYDRKKFIEEKNIYSVVIPNPKSFKSRQKSTLNNKQFLAAGRLNYQKGFDLLIESFQLFSKINNKWNLVIVGEGEEKENLNNLINKYGLSERVKIHEFTDDIQKYFLNSSVLLLSSRWEGMPMIVLESLEMGVPVISYDISAVTQIVTNEREALITKKFNINEFANNMIRVAENSDIIKEMGKNSLIRSKDYDIEVIINKWNDIFFDIFKGEDYEIKKREL